MQMKSKQWQYYCTQLQVIITMPRLITMPHHQASSPSLITTPHQHTSSTHLINTTHQHTSSTRLINPQNMAEHHGMPVYMYRHASIYVQAQQQNIQGTMPECV